MKPAILQILMTAATAVMVAAVLWIGSRIDSWIGSGIDSGTDAGTSPWVQGSMPTGRASTSAVLALTATEQAPGVPAAAEALDAAAIQPLIQRYCVQCHGPDAQKGGVRLDDLDPDMVQGPDAESWHSVLDMINSGEMPPKRMPQFSDAERRAVVGWITLGLEAATRAKQSQDHGSMRRLTKTQYTHTLNDLLGVGVDFGHTLPDDGKSEMGFSNNGEVLQVSPLHIDQYQKIARQALDKAIVSSDTPDTKIYRVTLGKNIDVDSPTGAVYKGYQTAPVNKQDFTVDILDRDGNPFQAATGKEQAHVNATRAGIGVGLRGSAGDRYSIENNGMLLYGALPHRERPPKSWQGPSPNIKMLIKNGYPKTGDFVFRVKASRGQLITKNHRMISLNGRPPLPPLNASNAIRVPAAQFKNVVNMVLQEDGTLLPEDIATASEAKKDIKIPAGGYYRIDLVHPYAPEDAMPSYRFSLSGLKPVQERLHLSPDLSEAGLITTPVALAYLNDGDYTVQLSGTFFVGFNEVLITPLDPSGALVQGLEGESDENLVSFGDTTPSIRVFAGGRTDDGQDFLNFDVPQKLDGRFGQEAVYTFKGRLENLPIPVFDPNARRNRHANTMTIGLWNNYLVQSAKVSGPPLVVHSMELEAPYYETWPPKTHTDIFFASPNQADPEKYTREVLGRFIPRAFRRPLEAGELDRYMGFWRLVREDHARYEDGVKEVLVAVLCSPHFLYLVDPDPLTDEAEQQVAEQLFLASRLSYFLWNSPPDDELLRLAGRGRLKEDLAAQIDRMVQDDRVWRMIRAFSHEWLRVDRHEAMNTNIDKYRDYNRFVREDMSEETYHFMHHVLIEDLSVQNFIASDFVMLNQNLAAFYGFSGVEGSAFRPVKVPDNKLRGGLLTQGAFLHGHSDGTQAHPIKRAVWLKEKILADPPPPPPPNVPELDPDTPGFEKLTLKEQLRLHRDKASCVDCHLKIDPYGVVFENFDAVGRFQTKARNKPIDAVSVLPDGTRVEGLRALQQYILSERKQDFLRSVVKHLFAYAHGRDVTFADEPEINRIIENLRGSDDRFQTVIKNIILSPSFSGQDNGSSTQLSKGA